MHPREGWQGHGLPRIPSSSRRDFLRYGAGAGALLGTGGLGALLAACGTSGGSPAATATSIPLPRPDNPVTWPLYSDNKAIANGLAPEKNATLRIYNWVAYLNPQIMKDFGKKYNCQVQLTTFGSMEEAVAKLRTGQLNFDVFMPTIDVMAQLVEGKLIQPLNHSYIPNISQAWPDYRSPFYDGKWQYTTPYTIYTTGIAWRKDLVREDPYQMANGYAMPWNPKYKGKVAILDDTREGIALGLLKNGITDVNTSDPKQINAAAQTLIDLVHMTNAKFDINDFSEIPTGQTWVHHAWSGDIASAGQYLPKGVSIDVVGYWFPVNGKGPVSNDLMTVPRGSTSPVLAHLFINYLLDVQNALTNSSYTGYMQPLTAMTADRMIAEGLIPKNLTSTIVKPSDLRSNIQELQLSVATRSLYDQAWAQVKNA